MYCLYRKNQSFVFKEPSFVGMGFAVYCIYVLCSCCSFSLLRALAAEFGACARMMRGKFERYDGYCLGGVCAHGKDKGRLTSEGRGDSGTGNEESPREPDKLSRRHGDVDLNVDRSHWGEQTVA